MRLLMVGEVRILNKEIVTEAHKRVASERFVDLSHDVEEGMITYKGLPAPVMCDFLSREDSRRNYGGKSEFHIGRIDMVANTGTYVDSPFHRYAEGKDLSQLSLDSLADLDTVVVRATDRQSVDVDAFEDLDLSDKAVLVHTGWDTNWKTDAYFEGHPFLTGDAADYLVEAGVKLVGIDSHNIDDTNDGYRPVHTKLLGANISIVEHMTGLENMPDIGARFFAVPVKVKDFGTFPVRAFGIS